MCIPCISTLYGLTETAKYFQKHKIVSLCQSLENCTVGYLFKGAALIAKNRHVNSANICYTFGKSDFLNEDFANLVN